MASPIVDIGLAVTGEAAARIGKGSMGVRFDIAYMGLRASVVSQSGRLKVHKCFGALGLFQNISIRMIRKFNSMTADSIQALWPQDGKIDIRKTPMTPAYQTITRLSH